MKKLIDSVILIINNDFIPDIILWDPIVQFGDLAAVLTKCPDCAQSLERKEWQNKQQSGMQPRLLHDVDGIVLLVSRTYICATGHRFLSHDLKSWIVLIVFCVMLYCCMQISLHCH